MRKPLSVVAAAVLVLTACGGSGLCIGVGGVVDVCKENFSRSECADYDDASVNGSDWTYATGTCQARGYTVACGPGDWVLPQNANICD